MVLQATPSEHWTFLTTRDSKPFSPAGFTNWFREICNEAALPRGLSRHGLQKAPRRSRVLRQRHRGYQRACLLAWSAAIPAAAELARMARSAIDSMAARSQRGEHRVANASDRFAKFHLKLLIYGASERCMVSPSGFEPETY